jgi:hypothetical protein
MPNGQEPGEHSLDAAADGFRTFERALSRRTARTTRSREDANTIRALFETWSRTHRPQLVAVLGENAAEVAAVDRQVRELRAQAGSQLVIADLRRSLREIVRTIERELLPAYDTARWTEAATAAPTPTGTVARGTLEARLNQVSADLALSYRQVLIDMADGSRVAFVGTVGELREVMRGAITQLAPTDAVRAESWYVGHDGRPTQTERIRYILQQQHADASDEGAREAAELVETRVGRFGRMLYSRTSGALHAGTQREELERIVGYVEAVLNEILPPLDTG